MQEIGTLEYGRLTQSGQELISRPSGAMVFLTSDGNVVKAIPYKWRHFPRSKRPRRFLYNCKRLNALGFRTVKVSASYDYRERHCHVLVYPLVEGVSLQDYLASDAEESAKHDLLMHAAAHYADLHNRGVFCRPMHFRNIIVQPDGKFALIDVENIRFHPWSLDVRMRARNFKYILKTSINRNAVISFGAEEFFDAYLKRCRMGPLTPRVFLWLLRRNVPRLFEPREPLDP